jgi:uncharacterized protein YgiM (DUF1202 family)
MGPSTSVLQFVLRISVILLSLGLALPVRAQSRVVATPAAVLSSPSGKAIGSVHPGTSLRVLEARGAYVKVTIDGFIERSRLSAQRGSSSSRVGNRPAVVRLRGATTAKSVGSLDAGTTVAVVSGNAPSGWAKVSRDGWILKSSLDKPSAETARASNSEKRTASTKSSATARKASGGEVAAVTRAPQGPSAVPARGASAGSVHVGATSTAAASAAVTDSTLTPTGNIALRAAPDAKALATVVQGATLTPLARDRGWVRVRLEGWVPERDVAPADTSIRTGVSAADLRADPVGTRGKLVRWSVQILARQKADVLRKDLAPDETYLLARGPYEENALLYLVVPPSLLVMTKAIPELSQAMITARVRNGRSDLVGVPILDLLTITPRK